MLPESKAHADNCNHLRIPKSIAIVEFNEGGHFLVYVDLLRDEALRQGWSVSILLPEMTYQSEQYNQILKPHEGTFTRLSLTKSSLRHAVGMAEERDLTEVILPHIDRHLHELMRLDTRAVTIRGLVVSNPRWEIKAASVPLRRRLKLIIKEAALRALSHKLSISVIWLDAPTVQNANKRNVACDPIIVSRAAAHAVRSSAPPFWFTIVGTPQPRKNPILVAQSVKCLRDSGVDARLRIAGMAPAQLSAKLAHILPSEALSVSSGPLTPEEFDLSIAAASAVVCAYSTHAPNSTVAKAAVLGTPIVAAGSQTFRDFVYDISGVESTTLNAKNIALLMRRVTQGDLRPTKVPIVGSEQFCHQLLGINEA